MPENTPEWTFDQVLKGDGKDPNPFYTAVNGKVVEIVWNHEENTPSFFGLVKEIWAAKYAEIGLSAKMYDPKYGKCGDNIKNYPDEYRALFEDSVLDLVKRSKCDAKVVGILKEE